MYRNLKNAWKCRSQKETSSGTRGRIEILLHMVCVRMASINLIGVKGRAEMREKMTDHNQLKMYHEDRRITDPEIIKAILDRNIVCTVALQDDPYPYIVPMNYGYIWDQVLILYMHMADQGHKVDLIRKNANISCNINVFLDRFGKMRYRREGHDYRSVSVFGKAEIITGKQPDEFLKGLNALCRNAGHNLLKKVPESKNLLILKVVAAQVTAKAQYPVSDISEVEMPPLDWNIK